MKVRCTYFWKPDRTMSLGEAVEWHLDGSGYGSGSVETAQKTAENCSKLLGDLIELLENQGTLRFDDLSRLGLSVERVDD